jgi:hypothetical protein
MFQKLIEEINSNAMELSRSLMKEMLGCYLQIAFSELFPSLINEALSKNDLFVGQDFISLEEATKRYNICRKTLYNYHNKQYITLHSSEGIKLPFFPSFRRVLLRACLLTFRLIMMFLGWFVEIGWHSAMLTYRFLIFQCDIGLIVAIIIN